MGEDVETYAKRVEELRLDNGRDFCRHFTFTEVLSIAMAHKKIFYMIYHFNIQGFKKFFDTYWNKKTLDLTKCVFKELGHLKFILEFFDNSRMHTVILPREIPIDIIGETILQKIKFQPNIDHPLSRKDIWNKRNDCLSLQKTDNGTGNARVNLITSTHCKPKVLALIWLSSCVNKSDLETSSVDGICLG